MADTVLQVFVFKDGAYIGSEMFTEPELVIGSGDGADLMLADAAIGDAHAILAREGEEVRLLDLGHAEGTRVNGAAVEHALVQTRDEIGLGRHMLKLKLVRSGARTTPSRFPQLRPPVSTADLDVGPSAPPAPSVERIVQTDVIRERRPTDDIDEVLADLEREVSSAGTEVGEANILGSEFLQPDNSGFGSVDEALADAFGDPRGDLSQPVGTDDLVPPTAEEPATVRAPMELLMDPRAASLAETFKGEETEATPMLRRKVSDPFPVQAEPPPPRLAHFLDEATVSNDAPQPADISADLVGPEPHPSGSTAPSFVPPAPSEPSAPEPTVPVAPEPHIPTAPSTSGLPEAPSEPTPEPALEVPELWLDEDEEEDDEELEAAALPGFSLPEALVRGAKIKRGGALEVICSEGGELDRIELLDGKRTFSVKRGGRRVPLAKHVGPGEADIFFSPETGGVYVLEGRQTPLDALKVPENAHGRKGDLYQIRLTRDATLTLREGTTGYHLRFAEAPPLPPPPPPTPFSQRMMPRAVALATFLIFLVFLGIGIFTPEKSYSETRREVWAEIKPDETRPVELPEPEPEPPTVEPEPEPTPEPEPIKTPPRPVRQPKKTARKKAAPAPVAKKAGVLGALGTLNKRAPGRKSMLAAVSNLNAQKVPGASSYRVAPLMNKEPTSQVRLAGGGGGKALTRGSASLLRGGSGFARISKKAGARVRGTVSKPVARKATVKGQISRAEVLKVINQHINEIQSCYERQLFSQPNLRGKLSLEWTIRLDGRTSKVRQKFSTLRSPKVASCIMKKMQRWRFPKPRGGVVVVSYPFVFDSSAY